MSEAFLKQYGIDINDSYFDYIEWYHPVIVCSLFLVSVFATQPAAKDQQKTKASQGMRYFIFVHNLALCAYSVILFCNTVPITWSLYSRPNGWYEACKFRWNDMYFESSWGFWAYTFYISKIYEFVDTWVVIARGRRPIFLQLFHHVGAVMGTWMGMVSRSSAAWIFMNFNSFIHSIMYFYYAMSAIEYKLPFKRIITQLQMTQFVVGDSLTLIQLFLFYDVIHLADKICIVYHVVYTCVLFGLFSMFYQKAYKSKKKDKKR